MEKVQISFLEKSNISDASSVLSGGTQYRKFGFRAVNYIKLQ